MVRVNIMNLIDEAQCYQTVRELRWPDGIACPSCQSTHVIKRGFDDTEPARQRYECHDCDQRFDDLTDTIFAGHHQPLKVWVVCPYLMGLNVPNESIAQELALHGSDMNGGSIRHWNINTQHYYMPCCACNKQSSLLLFLS
jgi:transposase-like protein